MLEGLGTTGAVQAQAPNLEKPGPRAVFWAFRFFFFFAGFRVLGFRLAAS